MVYNINARDIKIFNWREHGNRKVRKADRI